MVVGPFFVALWVHGIACWIDWLSPYEHTRLVLLGHVLERGVQALAPVAWPIAIVATIALFRGVLTDVMKRLRVLSASDKGARLEIAAPWEPQKSGSQGSAERGK